MNKIIYKKDELLGKFLNCSNGHEVLQQIKSGCEKNKEVVCNLTVNGKEISEQAESVLIDYKLQDLQIIEVETCSYDEFYGEFVVSSKDFIRDIVQVCPFMVEAAQDADYAKFEELFIDFITSMESLTSALQYIQKSQNDEAILKEWSDLEGALSDVLQQILNSYTEKDYVNLADLIEYEMIVELKKWHKVLEKINIHARGKERRELK